jgi:membrane fusion protein, multidrug efflux system
MTKIFGLAAVVLALSVGFPGCSSKGESKNAEDKRLVRPPVAVEVMEAASSDFTEGIDVVGSLSPKFSADVKSECVGIVTEVYVNEWVRVRKGAPLAKIDTREMDIAIQKARAATEIARANLLQAEVGGNRANREYERLLKLKEFGLVTQQALDDGLTEKEASTAKIEAAKAHLKAAQEDLSHTETRLSKTTICSPRDGVVSLRGVNVGDLVGEIGSAKAMFRIIDPSILELTATVPSGEMGAVHVGQPLVFSTDAAPGKAFSGRVMFINPVVSEVDRSVKVIAEVENVSEQLKGGLFVKGRIVTANRTGILKVPRTALLNWDVAGRKGDVFVLTGERARRRTIRTGSMMGDFVEIASGLSPGDKVIIRGSFNLKDDDAVNVIQAGGG